MKASVFVCAVLLSILSSLIPTCARAQMVIDSFGTPQNTAGVYPAAGTVLGSGIIGGERDMNSYLSMSINGAAPNQLSVVCPGSLQSGAGGDLTYDGVDHDPYSSSFDGLGSVDLTHGGFYDRFRFELTGVSGYGTSRVVIQVRQYSALLGSEGSSYTWTLPGSPGTVEIPFAAFALDLSGPFSGPVDFRDVGYIDFHFETGPGTSFTVGGIAAVPEPSALALTFCAALACLAPSFRKCRR